MALTRIAESRNRQHGKDNVIQEFGTVYPVPIGLGENVRSTSIGSLNQTLADTMVLRDLYKKHHWQVSGPTFYQLHLLFDKHYAEQVELIDAHEKILIEAGRAAKEASQNGDEGTNDLFVSDVIRTNEMHVFFLCEHLADGDPHGHQKGP